MDLEPLLNEAGVPFESRAPLGQRTWYGIGGSAAALAHPETPEQLARLVAHCHREGVSIRVLGKGANLLVPDGVVDGITVSLDAGAFRRIEIAPEAERVTVGGGADLARTITDTVRAGLAGLEGLAGIPATIGGALRMNAGGAFGEIGPAVDAVTVIEADGTLNRLDRSALSFGYRRSNLRGRIVVEAELRLRAVSDRAALRERLLSVMRHKKGSQPMAASSAGCAFKNPPKEVIAKGAGQLIDEAGLKAWRVGGAEVSPVHANFVVLHPDATANDVLALMRGVQRRVARRFGVELEREVVVWNEPDAPADLPPGPTAKQSTATTTG